MPATDPAAKGMALSRPVGLTRQVIDELLDRRIEQYPEPIVRRSTQCVLDWFAVGLAGAAESGPRAILEEVVELGGKPQSTVFGHATAVPALTAALFNGTASHVLDYDDVNFSMSAHPSVAILPALLALAEREGASGRAVIESYVAGYEAGCRVGLLVAPAHYESGFHGTATIGTFAAMAACAHLLRLSADQTDHAFGIAATQAAGIRSMFGTDCKALHAGKAAQNGLLAALLASRGFCSSPGVLESGLGFARTHSVDFNAEAALARPPGGYFLTGNLFKYHAACYMTHASADAIAMLIERHAVTNEQVVEARLFIDPALHTVCNIAEPSTGLESKFSVRAIAALTLVGIDTSKLTAFDAGVVARPDVQAALRKVSVQLRKQPAQTCTDVELALVDGRVLRGSCNAGVPDPDLDRQGRRLAAKFSALTEPVLGIPQSAALLQALTRIRALPEVREVMRLSVPNR